MSYHQPVPYPEQQELFNDEDPRSLLDKLLTDSQLYHQSKDYKELLEFVVRLREFAPFNAMLLQVQKPGLRYAASALDWLGRFERKPKVGARPLLILWPFGPVALVYDVLDTEGKPIPENVEIFVVHGSMSQDVLNSFKVLLTRKHIAMRWVDEGDGKAGLIGVIERPSDDKGYTEYQIYINDNHDAPVQFNTLAHELGHLFLGHLGRDKKLSIPIRQRLTHKQQEIEAESVAYIVCHRNGIQPKSQTYLSSFVDSETTLENIDVYQVMRADGQVETALKLASHSRFEQPESTRTGYR